MQKKAEERWGAGVVEQVSFDLQHEFPNAEGLSAPNLWAMKRWYLFYNQHDTKLLQPVIEYDKEKLQQPVGEFPSSKLHQTGGETENLKLLQSVREFE